MTAGVAAADVTVGGWAYGILYAGDAMTADGSAELQRGVRIDFSASVETDSGLGLSAYTRMTSANGSTGAANIGYNRVQLSYSGMTLQLGSANGAARIGARYTGGFIGVDDSGVGAVNLNLGDNSYGGVHADGNGDNAVLSYKVGDVTLAASTKLAGGGTNEFGARYSANGLTVGIGANDNDQWMALVTYTAGDITVSAGSNSDEKNIGSISYKFGDALTVSAIAADQSIGTSYGLDVTYDLGGGANFSAQAGQAADGDNGVAAGIFFKF
jgi:outer membrane protein OmpU